MIIADLDYLDFKPEASAMYLYGSGAVAISKFLADAYGSSTYTGTVVNNLVISRPYGSFAISSVNVTAIASGSNTFASASASSIASVS
ncbi:hypothetical protein [Planktothrix agardhii]|jgi:hypothetical protein|uniref:hypothetical protein n=1 Tax=Planktothrix agardhii TaxID=1160 RepID=UPI0028ACDDF0|nr:hypothetical protein [Planktothrix agardhii]